MSFSSDEIQAAIEKLLKTKSTRRYGSLGESDIEVTFNDIQEAVAGTFLLTPEAPFYAVFLGTRRLKESSESVLAMMSTIYSLLNSLGRNPEEIGTEELRESQVALLQLEGALKGRTSGVKSLSGVPAYQRFLKASQSFLAGAGQQVKSGPTASEARSLLAEMLVTGREALAEVTRVSASLSGSIENYAKVSLTDRVFKTVVQKARKNLDAQATAMEKASQTERQKLLRAATLDVLAAKSLIQGFGSFVVPLEERTVSGVLLPYSDATHEVNPPSILVDLRGPYAIETGGTLSVKCEDEQVDLSLTRSYVPVLVSGPEPWNIRNTGGGLSSNRDWKIKIAGEVVTITLMADAAASAASVATQLDTALASYGLKASAEGSSGQQVINITFEEWEEHREIEVVVSPANEVLGFQTGYVWSCSKTSPAQICEQINGQTTRVVASTVFTPEETVAFKTVPLSPAFVLRRGTGTVSVPTLGGLKLALTTTGIHVGDVVSLMSGDNAFTQWTISYVDPAFIEATNSLVGDVSPATGIEYVITVPKINDREFVRASLGTATVSITKTGTRAADCTLEAGDIPADLSQVIIHSGPNAGTLWNVVGSSGSTLQLSSTSQDAVDAVGADAEFIPLVPYTLETVLVVEEGVLAGRYTIKDSVGYCQGDLGLETLLLNSSVGTRPIPIEFDGILGTEKILLASADKTTSSKLEILESELFDTFFFTSPAAKYADTPWVLVPDGASSLEVGDTLRFYKTDYATPTQSSVVTALEGNIAKVSTPMSCADVWDLDAANVPFARVSFSSYTSFKFFKTGADVWATNMSGVWENIERLVNVVLRNTRAADFQINDAKSAVLSALTVMGALPFAIDAFVMEPIQELNTILRSLREKGAERAVDILLEGNFTEFFSLDVDGVSYATHMLKSAREVAREDMPVRKVGRSDRKAQREIASSEGVDFEYSKQDIDESPRPDNPEGY